MSVVFEKLLAAEAEIERLRADAAWQVRLNNAALSKGLMPRHLAALSNRKHCAALSEKRGGEDGA